jgi:hypothetical protein
LEESFISAFPRVEVSQDLVLILIK